MHTYDVHVRGAGVVSRCLALSLARLGLRVALSAPQVLDAPDVRAFALNAASQHMLKSLKVWDGAVAEAATSVYDMWIQTSANPDGAPAEVALAFSAWQQKVGELAWIVDATPLAKELENAVRFSPQITVISDTQDLRKASPARRIDNTVRTYGEEITTTREAFSVSPDKVQAPLTAICEGRFSSTRDELGVQFDQRDYGQTAIAARLQSSDPHQGMAHQWFLSPEVLALLPCGSDAHRSSGFALVWSVPHERAQVLQALTPDDFLTELAKITHSRVGELQLSSEQRAAWSLALGQAHEWSGSFPTNPTQSWVLLGDAAHTVHPLAGQGLNLGLADVAALTQVLTQRETWRPVSDQKLLRRYQRERQGATWAMQRATDGLLHLFAHPSNTVKTLRNHGLGLLNHATPIKRWLAAHAMGSSSTRS
jgi:ubiquinone biosynthesis UbiH/UbiF/VisC/COQ6 family hydroxylase